MLFVPSTKYRFSFFLGETDPSGLCLNSLSVKVLSEDFVVGDGSVLDHSLVSDLGRVVETKVGSMRGERVGRPKQVDLKLSWTADCRKPSLSRSSRPTISWGPGGHTGHGTRPVGTERRTYLRTSRDSESHLVGNMLEGSGK